MEEQMPFEGLPEPSPETEAAEEASEGALAAAEQFLLTVASGDARAMWEMFSDSARAYIIGLGHERGMDFDLVSRLKQGTASGEELDEFLGDLMIGIQRDLAGLDYHRLAFESVAQPEAPLQVRVNYLVRLGPELEGLQAAIPAGSILLSLEIDEWKVERLVPRPGGDAAPETGVPGA